MRVFAAYLRLAEVIRTAVNRSVNRTILAKQMQFLNYYMRNEKIANFIAVVLTGASLHCPV